MIFYSMQQRALIGNLRALFFLRRNFFPVRMAAEIIQDNNPFFPLSFT